MNRLYLMDVLIRERLRRDIRANLLYVKTSS